MFINQIYALKTKRLFQSVLMIANFDPCFWSKTMTNKLEEHNTVAEQLHCKTVFSELVLLFMDTLWESLRFNYFSYLIL